MRFNLQISEYDCATTSLLNALVFLYKRDEIPQDVLKIIYRNTLDCKNKIIGDCGTSKKAMKKISNKINKYSKKHNFDLKIAYLTKKNCDINKIIYCINKHGVVIIRSLLDLEHYFLITNIDDEYLYILDPYSLNNINNCYNIKIRKNDFDSQLEKNYSFMPINKREMILFNKIKL